MTERKRIFRGDRLKKLREARDITQDELAGRLGFSQSQVNKYESGRSEPTPEVITRIAREFEVTTDYLLGLVDNTDGHIVSRDLSPLENRLLDMWRRGDFGEMIKMAAEQLPGAGRE